MKIGIVNDHRGYKLKIKLLEYLKKKGYEIIDYGSFSTESVDYPDYGFLIGEKVVSKEVECAIAICGSGIGISIACNKVKGIRCAKVNNSKEAKLSRLDNNANIIAIGEKTLFFEAKDIVDAFLTTKYESVERFDRRLKKIEEYEEKER